MRTQNKNTSQSISQTMHGLTYTLTYTLHRLVTDGLSAVKDKGELEKFMATVKTEEANIEGVMKWAVRFDLAAPTKKTSKRQRPSEFVPAHQPLL